MRTISAARLAALLGPDPLPRPAYLALADAVRRLVTDGRVLVGTRLPSERDLVEALGLSRTTVVAAMDRLREDGFLVTRRGSGSVVVLPGQAGGLATGPGLLPRGLPEDVIDLTYAALPAAPGVTEAFERSVNALAPHLTTRGYHPLGLDVTRDAIAAWYESRGLPTDPAQIIVTCGGHAALSSLLRALLDPGQRIVLETPSYPNAIVGARRSHGRIVPVPVDSTGWDLDGFADALRKSNAKLAYLIPDFQNPTGLLMEEAERARLVALARRHSVHLVIDETFVELGVDKLPPPPVAVHHPSVITIGSASKAYWGGLRVGWVRTPAPLSDPILQARHSLDLGTPVLEQIVLADLLAQPRLLDDRRVMVREARDALAAALRRHVPEWSFTLPPGGLSLWCALPEGRGEQLTAVAEQHGVRVARGAQFSPEPGMDRYVRIPVCVPVDQCDEVGRRLAAAWTQALALPEGPLAGSRLIA